MGDLFLKRGASFSFFADIVNETDTPQAGIGGNLTSQIRTAGGKLLSDLVITEIVDIPGRYLFSVLVTNNFPIGYVELDICLVSGSVRVYSETIKIAVIKEVTKNE